MHAKVYAELIEKARAFGIKDPHLLSIGDLRRAVQLCEGIDALRRHALSIDIELPATGSRGTLERIFREAVTKKLDGIVKGSTVTRDGEEWTVENIHPVRADPRSTRLYILRPVGGGRPIPMPDYVLVGYLYRNTL